MQSPADGVPPALIRHLHLISTFSSKFPFWQSLHVERAVEYLSQAPRIVKGEAPMVWEYLNAPPDGKVYLAWLPEARAGAGMATDGYQYVDGEQQWTMQVAGYNVEILMHKSGYRPHFELSAMHKRIRYRITGINNPNMVGAPFDPSLWIIHYAAADPQHRVDTSRIQLPVQWQRLWNERRALESTLRQLERKEFMLEDRYNWPTVTMPQTPFTGNYPQQQMYSGNTMAQMAAVQRQRQQYYQQNQGTMPGPGPAKRPRHNGPSQITGSGPTMVRTRVEQDPMVEEEESAAMEDLLDFLTPREISKMRYKQHHEWVEEILNSPYTVSQIVPIDLGLGLMGELGQLTEGLFDAPSKNAIEVKKAPRYKKVDADEVKEFENRVTKHIEDGKAELENMRQEHAARMAQIKRSRRFAEAERNLTNADWEANHTGNEPWRIECRMGETPNGEGRPEHTVEQVVRQMEESVGNSIIPYTDVVCVQKGGLSEPDEDIEGATALPQYPSAGAESGGILDHLQDLHNPAAGVLDQYGNSSNHTATLQDQASGSLESTTQVPSEPRISGQPPDATLTQAELQIGGIEPLATMQDNQGIYPEPQDVNIDDEIGAAEVQATGWVMVEGQDANDGKQDQGQFDNEISGTEVPGEPGEQVEDTTDMFDPTGFGDFANLDGAGEALEGYGGGDDDLGLNLEDSAFADAFQLTGEAADAEDTTGP